MKGVTMQMGLLVFCRQDATKGPVPISVAFGRRERV